MTVPVPAVEATPAASAIAEAPPAAVPADGTPAPTPFSLPPHVATFEELPVELRKFGEQLYSPRGRDNQLQLNMSNAPEIARQRDNYALRVTELEQKLGQQVAPPEAPEPAAPEPAPPAPGTKPDLAAQLKVAEEQSAMTQTTMREQATTIAAFKASEADRKTTAAVHDGFSELGISDGPTRDLLIYFARGAGGEFDMLGEQAIYRAAPEGPPQTLADTLEGLRKNQVLARALDPTPANLGGPPGGPKPPAGGQTTAAVAGLTFE